MWISEACQQTSCNRKAEVDTVQCPDVGVTFHTNTVYSVCPCVNLVLRFMLLNFSLTHSYIAQINRY